jgi:hypothetical protein
MAKICPQCAIPIGVYEPFIWLLPDGSKVDSAAARDRDRQAALDSGGVRMHRFCARRTQPLAELVAVAHRARREK